MPLSTKAVAFQTSTLMCFFERSGGFVDVIIPQSIRHDKNQRRAVDAYRCVLIGLNNGRFHALAFAKLCNKICGRKIFDVHGELLSSSFSSIIFSLLPIDVRQYGTRAAISTWHSWSTYRNRAIFRSYLPSGARFITAFICSALSPCNAGGKTMRAAATGSTEPKRLRQLSGVSHHIANDCKMVCFRGATKTCADHFRDVPKLFLCGEHLGDVTEMVVCSAAHGVTPHFPIAGFFSASAFFIMLTAFSITLSSTSSVMKGFSQSGSAPRSAAKTCAFFFAP